MDTVKIDPIPLTGITRLGRPKGAHFDDTGNPTIQRWHYADGSDRMVLVGGMFRAPAVRVRCKVQRARLAAAGAQGWR